MKQAKALGRKDWVTGWPNRSSRDRTVLKRSIEKKFRQLLRKDTARRLADAELTESWR